MNITKEQMIFRAWSPRIERHASLSSGQLEEQTAEFLASGGAIKRLPSNTAPHTGYAARERA